MRKFVVLLLLLILYFTSCNQRGKSNENSLDLKGYSKRTVLLEDSLGRISIYLPNEIDTFFKFNNHELLYPIWRFSGKKYTLDDGDGFYDPIIIDSTYQFSICLKGKDRFYVSDSDEFEDILHQWRLFLSDNLNRREGKIKVSNHTFVFISYCYSGRKPVLRKDTNKIQVELRSATLVKKELVTFDFIILKKDTVGFMNKVLTSLKTIDIDTTH